VCARARAALTIKVVGNIHFLLREFDVSPPDHSTSHYREVLDDVCDVFLYCRANATGSVYAVHADVEKIFPVHMSSVSLSQNYFVVSTAIRARHS
jgi:hypothetical protein